MKKTQKLWRPDPTHGELLRDQLAEHGWTYSFPLLRRFRPGGYEGFIAVRDIGSLAEARYGFGDEMVRSAGKGQMSAIIVRLRPDGIWNFQALESPGEVRRFTQRNLSPRLLRRTQLDIHVEREPYNQLSHPNRRYYYPWEAMVLLKEIKRAALARGGTFDTTNRARYDSRKPTQEVGVTQQPPVSP